ncbi:MAG: hypothetical protein KatS3mg071_0419 [Meiothermus sp.]|nr:MAG: hypothetical protein KatS3mg071_0419 [Meiothermus sp.]
MEIAYALEHPVKLELSLQVRGFTVLLGESGVGKTSLLKAIAGLIPARGQPFAGLRAEARRVGYLPQHLGPVSPPAGLAERGLSAGPPAPPGP